MTRAAYIRAAVRAQISPLRVARSMSIGRSQDLKVSVALPHSYPAGALRPLNSALASHLCTLLRTPVCAISCSAWFACTQEMRRAFSRKKSTQGVNAAPKPRGSSSAARGRKRSSSRGRKPRKPRALPSISDVLESALRRGLAAKAEADEERASEKAERAVQRASRAAARSRTPSPSAPASAPPSPAAPSACAPPTPAATA